MEGRCSKGSGGAAKDKGAIGFLIEAVWLTAFQFQERCLQLHSSNTSRTAAVATVTKKKAGRLQGLLRDNLQTDSEAEDDAMNSLGASSEPWKVEFELYLERLRLG
jgi:hypothetical protein